MSSSQDFAIQQGNGLNPEANTYIPDPGSPDPDTWVRVSAIGPTGHHIDFVKAKELHEFTLVGPQPLPDEQFKWATGRPWGRSKKKKRGRRSDYSNRNSSSDFNGRQRNTESFNNNYQPQPTPFAYQQQYTAPQNLAEMIAGNSNENNTGRSIDNLGAGQLQHGRSSSVAMSGNASSHSSDKVPMYGQAVTWKSDKVKSQEEYHRTSQRVRAIAPEMLKEKARPIGKPANIFPRNTAEWIDFKSGAIEQRLDEVNQSVDLMKGQVAAAVNMEKEGVPRPSLLPAFGDEPGQKRLRDGMSTVLAQPTIWSNNNVKTDHGQAGWPSRAELLMHGDNRPRDHTGARVNRSLPPPRLPPQLPKMTFAEQQVVNAFFMDHVGRHNVYHQPNEPTAAEIEAENKKMNEDPMFEANAMHYLGSSLMDEVGRFQQPKNAERRSKVNNGDASNDGTQLGPYPQVSSRRREVVVPQMSEDERMLRAYAAANGLPIPLELKYEGRDIFSPGDVTFIGPGNRIWRFRFGVGWLPQ